ncbi:hypothetical protein C7S16_1854 [Burkholderia thailandensis]|uniref:Uncharacterized protein n=1 Tax=Burkholderia thailandensis TaxID=57975 RepID=A0AAW9CZ57_BURTH|nr:hypothetical protein [Burkholderia thailandensis]
MVSERAARCAADAFRMAAGERRRACVSYAARAAHVRARIAPDGTRVAFGRPDRRRMGKLSARTSFDARTYN